MVLNDIISLVEEKCDGRSFGIAKHKRWADLVRSEVARSAFAAGFHGLYFLYKESDVIDGSTANQARYALPDDFVDDLSLWYDGIPIIKAAPGVMNITTGCSESQAPPVNPDGPAWFVMRGMEFEFIPAPPDDGKRIALFYNGLPDPVTSADFTDYFMNQWSALHVYGMSEYALDSVGGYVQAQGFRKRFTDELQRLMLDNRRFWLKGTKMRLQNWDEFQEKERYLFPQFGNLPITGDRT
jgi:hypothetical protein